VSIRRAAHRLLLVAVWLASPPASGQGLTTGALGGVVVADLPPGVYRLVVHHGHAAWARSGLVVALGQTRHVRFTIDPGAGAHVDRYGVCQGTTWRSARSTCTGGWAERSRTSRPTAAAARRAHDLPYSPKHGSGGPLPTRRSTTRLDDD
jgi:hypothetical protein